LITRREKKPNRKTATSGVQRKSPYPFQKEIIEKTVEELLTEDRATIVMPCGSGKTLVALWTVEHTQAQTVAVFAPTLGLLAQTAKEFLSNTRYDKVACLAICSDSSVARGLDEIRPSPDEVPFAVTCKTDIVSHFLKSNVSVKFLFCTYQSTDVLGSVLIRLGKTLDFAVFDEAHRTAGLFGAPFTFALSDKNLPVHKRLFMTATPRVNFLPDRLSPMGHSMDNISDYGRICARLSFAEAVRMKVICPYKVILSVIDTSSLPLELLDTGVVEGEEIDVREAAIRESLAQVLEKYGLRKVITYHSTIERAERFISNVMRNALSDYEKLHVSSEMSGKARGEAMERFRNSTGAIISNARCLTEGINVPATDLAVLVDPKSSEIDIVQVLGRVMRMIEGKKSGYIFLPIFLDRKANESIEEALARGNYEMAWEVLQALGGMDETLEWDMSLYRRGLGLGGTNGWPNQIEIMTPPGVDAEKIRESVEVFIVRRLTDSWEENYGKLLRYKREHGDISIPHGSHLYDWLRYQKSRWRLLFPGKRKLLLDVGIDLTPRPMYWQRNFEQLCAFKAEHGHLTVPFNSKLGRWVIIQRMYLDRLPAERREALLELGFDADPRETRWQNNLEKFRAFVKEHECSDTLQFSMFPKYLRNWIKHQRKRWNLLSPQKRETLLELGFDPDPIETHWRKRLEELCAYKERHGHCNIRKNENPIMWSFLKALRESKSEGRLSPEKIAALDELNIVWGGASERFFEDTCRKLAAYREKHGRLPSSNTRLKEDRELRILIGRIIIMRRSYRTGNLSDEQIRRLQDLGLSFHPDEERWQTRFREFERYVAEGGNPNEIRSAHPLRGWVRAVLNSHRRGTLSGERIEMLEKLGVTWEDRNSRREKIQNDRWENNYRAVEEYFKENTSAYSVHEGNALPSSHPCYDWWKNQLLYFYALPPDKAEKIRSLKPAKIRGVWSKAEKNIVYSNPDKSEEELTKLLIGRTPEAIRMLRLKFGWAVGEETAGSQLMI
jgi:superfamily II DNA or RNA helicase